MAELKGNVLGKVAMIAALLAAAWEVAMLAIGGATFPGYNHLSQFISELGATGAPRGFEVSWYGFVPIGILMIAFSISAWLAAPRSVLATLGFVGIFLYAVGFIGTPLVGLSQRVIEASVIGWIVACGIYLGTRPRVV